MSRNTTVIPFRQPDAIDDPLTEVAREGARQMLAQVLIAEADAFVAQWKDLKLPEEARCSRYPGDPGSAVSNAALR
jgi:putative transposase